MNLLIYTAIFGDYDDLIDPAEDFECCDFICITNQRHIKSDIWSVLYVPAEDVAATEALANRKYKMLPSKYFPDYKYTLYIDANVKLTYNPFELVNKYLTTSPIAYPRHNLRNCIYQEAKICLNIGKISDSEYKNIIDRLSVNAYPHNIGLAENNILLRRNDDVLLNSIMLQWWHLIETGDRRDQLSLMYLLWKNNCSFNFMNESSRNKNKYFDYTLHKNDLEKSTFKRKIMLMSARRHKNIMCRSVGFGVDIYESIRNFYIKIR